MRLLRALENEASAQQLVDALADHGVETLVRESAQGPAVWVLDEQQREQAEQLTSRWLDGGEREALEQSAARALHAREQRAQLEEHMRRREQAIAERLIALARPRPAPLAWGLIALCVALRLAIFLLSSRLGHDEETMVSQLSIAELRAPLRATAFSLFGLELRWLALPLREPWRLFTPALLHLEILHLVLNMLWLRDLGRIVESVHGTLHFALFTLSCAVVANVAEYELGQHAAFGGMSGVIFGLLGIVWLRGRLDPYLGYVLPPPLKHLMLIWIALGFLGNFGVGNWGHLSGLSFGLAWGYLAHRVARARRR